MLETVVAVVALMLMTIVWLLFGESSSEEGQSDRCVWTVRFFVDDFDGPGWYGTDESSGWDFGPVDSKEEAVAIARARMGPEDELEIGLTESEVVKPGDRR